MPNNQTKKLVQGSMAVALFTIIILLAFYVPVVNIVAMVFALLPIAWFTALHDRKDSVIVVIAATLVATLFGGIMILLLALVFVIVGFVIGDAIRTKKSKIYLFMSTGTALLFTFALQYVVLVKFFETDFIKESMNMAKASYEQSLKLAEQLPMQQSLTTENLEEVFRMMEAALPSTIILSAFILAFVLISINLPLLKRFGIDVPKFASFKMMRLPRAVLWYYLIVLSINLFVQPEVGTFLYVAVLNASVVLWLLLTLQGLSFIFFLLDEYKSPGFLKGLVVLIALPLYSFIILLGIIDLGFNIREYMKDKIQKK
ncbi:hypothetical protein A0U40_08875 [[Bacillus] sp. KCTC 13219]|uniref:YybS family protein n=1 Tax=Metasolibacillus fluoroglycofenilyticus TaxID=1239396 RepID=UPI000798F4BD|nr:DUF2232 domain-containing protein [Metasolibacillus fluoroglycofenilyticus]KYG89831.1 hypothetical protein A0U40_08875 [[Bacillus] sp. KCTC 13219]